MADEIPAHRTAFQSRSGDTTVINAVKMDTASADRPAKAKAAKADPTPPAAN